MRIFVVRVTKGTNPHRNDNGNIGTLLGVIVTISTITKKQKKIYAYIHKINQSKSK